VSPTILVVEEKKFFVLFGRQESVGCFRKVVHQDSNLIELICCSFNIAHQDSNLM